jgi:hypothetical protein
LNGGICICKLAARIDLCRLHWSSSLMWLTFSSEVRVFPEDFTRNRLPVVPSLFSQNRILFCIDGWCPYRVLKWRWTAVRDFNSASHNMHWTCSCGVDIVNDLAEGHLLAHAHKPGMKKDFQSFPFRWHKLDTCTKII